LGRAFKSVAPTASGRKLAKTEFNSSLRGYGVEISRTDCEKLLDFLDVH
jgi:hypothetical protein